MSLLLPLSVSAEMYRWVDAQGRVHYSQVRPNQGKAETITPAPEASRSSSGASRSSLSRYAEQLQSDNAAKDGERAKSDELAQRRKQNCDRARGELQVSNDYAGRTFSLNAKGEREYWSAEQTAQVRARLQSQIAENCD